MAKVIATSIEIDAPVDASVFDRCEPTPAPEN